MFGLAWITVFENSRGSTMAGAERLSWPDNSLAEEGGVAAAVPVFCLPGGQHKSQGTRKDGSSASLLHYTQHNAEMS